MKHERKSTLGPAADGWLLCVLMFCLAVGCATPAAVPPVLQAPEEPSPLVAGRGWWAVRFGMDREGDQTRWERDLLIAHRIVAPILAAEAAAIDLWRFHRRSNDDSIGHRFSFLFYSDAATADRINRGIIADRLLTRLHAAGVIRGVQIDSADISDRPSIGDTSDRNWSPVMRNAWPYYIMGVSRMWLSMIDQVDRQTDPPLAPPDSPEGDTGPDAALDAVVAHYQVVNAEVTRIWQEEGYHALLHHLNAIYGYEPLVYWEKRWKSF